MADLIAETPEAYSWVMRKKLECLGDYVFGHFEPGVIWIDNSSVGGEPIGVTDPSVLVSEINTKGWPLYRGHDPGLPSGKVIAAKLFISQNGINFVAAILGFYVDRLKLNFDDLGIDSNPEVSSPLELGPIPNDCWLDISTDPREIDPQWLQNVLRDPPLPVVQRELSHNAEEWEHELIRIGLVYLLIVWNPFITTVAREAAKDVYSGTRQWLRNVWDNLVSCRDPIISLESYQNGCNVLFLIRGKDVKRNYAAHDAIPIAAAKAAVLIESMKSRQVEPLKLVYEFDPEHSLWFPLYAILEDGRLVSDCNILIALEHHHNNLSIGIQSGIERSTSLSRKLPQD